MKTKRFFAALLCAMLLITLLPEAAFAAGESAIARHGRREGKR